MKRDLIELALRGGLNLGVVDSVCNENGCTRSDVINHLAIAIARQFLRGDMTFTVADDAINGVQGCIVGDFGEYGNGYELPQPAFDIYRAFDVGEFDDTTLASTRKRLQEMLKHV